jgi:hypothetical protein
MVRLGAADLATLDSLITAGIVDSRAEGLRWALSHLREHPAYARLKQQAAGNDDLPAGDDKASTRGPGKCQAN